MFCLASELESCAVALRLEALQHMTISMAGVDCKDLFALMTAFFGQGTDFAVDPFNYLDGAPSIRPPLALTDMKSKGEGEETASKASTSTAAPTTTPAPQGSVDILEPKEPCVKDSLHNTGIPLKYHMRHSGSSQKGRSIYMCPYDTECSTPPLGHCCVCPYCGFRFYNTAGWRDHMTAKHAGMPFYGCDLNPKLYPAATSVAVAGESLPASVTIPYLLHHHRLHVHS